MTDYLPRRSRDRSHPAQVGEGRLAVQAVRILSYSHQERGGGVDADAGDRNQVGSSLPNQPRELIVEFADLLRELEIAAGDGAQRELGGRCDVVGTVSRTKSRRPADQLDRGQASQLGPQPLGSSDEHTLELVGRLGTRLYRRTPGGTQHPDHLDLAVRTLGLADGRPCEHRSCGKLGVYGVGLARTVLVPSLRPAHLQNLDLPYPQEATQPGAESPRSLDPDPLQPAIRVARDPGMEPDQIDQEVRKTLAEYEGELDLSRQKVQVGEQGLEGVAVGPIPGQTPYIEVFVPRGKEVYRIDLYGTELDAEARDLLKGVRFEKPQRSVASLDLPASNSESALYPNGGPDSELLERAEIPGATDAEPTGDEPAAFTTKSTSTKSTSTKNGTMEPSEVPRYSEERVAEGCWRANSRFWMQTQHDATANAARGDGIPTGFSVVGRPNYWGQFTHGELDGYGRCNSNYYTNDKFAVDYPYNRGDRIYSPFDGGTVVFAGQTRSHRGLGIFVVIRDDNGKYVSSSGHLNGLAPGIQPGARVGKNTVIGYAGNTGSGSVPTGEVHNHQAFYRYPSYTKNGAPYGGRGLQTLYYHYAGTAAGDGGGVVKLGWSSTSYQKAEGDRISN